MCAFGTALVAAGSTESVQFTHALVQRGMADCLVKHLSATMVREEAVAVMKDPPE